MAFPKDPKEGQTYQALPLTGVQRHVVKDAANKLRSIGLSSEALYLDSLLEAPITWSFSKGAWWAAKFKGAEGIVTKRKRDAVKPKNRPATAARPK